MKKLIAAILSLLVFAAIFAFFLPKQEEESETAREDEGFTVGVGKIDGAFSPFLPSSDGDDEVKRLVIATMTQGERDTTYSAAPDIPSVAESYEIFYADPSFERIAEYTDGAYTAVTFVIKNGLTFSNGRPLTADDAVFSLYTLLDPQCESAEKSFFSTLAGYDDYVYGKEGISGALDTAIRIMSLDVGDVPADGDGYSAQDAADMRASLLKSGAEYAERIKAFVLEKYCTDTMTSSYIDRGVTPDDVRSNEALSNAYTMRMWNYGNFVYNYVEDPEGEFVGTTDALGNTVYKTTYESAMENDMYVSYVRDDEFGLYYYSYADGTYLPADENTETFIRYTKVLSDKFVRLSRSSLAGFRDTEGSFYTLTDGSFPTMEDFFVLMKNSYTSENGFDWESMEKMESADSYSFSEEAVKEFAVSHSSDASVNGIAGIKKGVDPETSNETVTLYFKGNDYLRADGASFGVVSKEACLKGFDLSGCTLNDIGTPFNSEEFFAHISDYRVSTVSAGPYVIDSYDKESGRVFLNANRSFDVFGTGIAATESITLKDVTDCDTSSMLSSGELMKSIAPVTKNDIAGAGDNTAVIYYPNRSYKYLLINPAYYKNIETRRGIASVIDPSVLYSDSTSAISRCVPTFFDSYAGDAETVFDASGESALAHFIEAGYIRGDDGVLTDPSTKDRAHFKFYIMPEDAGGKTEEMLNGAITILRNIGADGEVIADADLKTRIYSDENVPIYVLGWEVSRDLSMYERYAYSSGASAVKGCGLEKLYTVGQLDSVGKITYKDAYGNVVTSTQSDAVEELDRLIKLGTSSSDRAARRARFIDAEQLVTDLVFEIPLCEYNSAFLVRRDLVDVSTLFDAPTSEAGPLSEIWKVRLTDGD